MTDVSVTVHSEHSHLPSQDRPLWGGLKPGPHAVGFATSFAHDYSRIYAPSPSWGASPKQLKPPRPILINVWYPAQREPMAHPLRHHQYLELNTARDAALEAFVSGLVAFNLEVICQEVMGKRQEEMSAAERDAFEQFLDAPTAAVRDAVPKQGPFPLVLNHQGLGGAFEDNAVLFEYLASHGYIVANSAFQSEDTSYFNVDWDLERSVKDLDSLINVLRARPDFDLRRVGVMGQSFGGQAALAWRAERNSMADAVVTLDSTIEYMPQDAQGGSVGKLNERFARVERFCVPMLLFASKRSAPNFARTDALRYSERYYATVDHLQHNDYICHGAIGSDIRRQLRPEDAEATLVRESYERICAHTLRFFDAFLKEDAGALAFLEASVMEYGADAAPFSLRHLGAVPLPPTGAQLADLVLTEGMDAALDVCGRLGSELREETLNDAGSLVLTQGTSAQAIPLFAKAVEMFPLSENAHDSLGEAYAEVGDTAAAIQCYERAEGLLAADMSPSERTLSRLAQVRLVLEGIKGDSQGSAEESSAGPSL